MGDVTQASPAPRKRLSLTRADLQTSLGLELLGVLQTIAGDGRLTHDEVEELRAWLEASDAATFPGHSHLQVVIDDVLADGVITDDEFEVLHDAVLRVLPAELRSLASLRRRERRTHERADRQQAKVLERDQKSAELVRNRPLPRGDFIVAGTRYGDRQHACGLCSEDDPVWLQREPDNEHDRNAILVETDGGDSLGYVPREDAREFAPILDGGARQHFTVKKTLEVARGQTIPVVRGASMRTKRASVTPVALRWGEETADLSLTVRGRCRRRACPWLAWISPKRSPPRVRPFHRRRCRSSGRESGGSSSVLPS